MAKKNKSDGVPIEFHIPSADLGGEGSRVPVPINQPKWKYKISSDPKQLAIAGSRVALFIAVVLGALLIISRMYTSPLWIAVIVSGIISFVSARSAKSSEFQNEENGGNDNAPKRKNRKHPKRHKDHK